MVQKDRFDGCEVSELLDSGPVSELYRGRQLPLGRPVLIKAIGPGILPSSPFAQALEREARLLSELDHPNVLALHEFVIRPDRMWMVLEDVDGWSLEQVLSKLGKLPQASAVAVALGVSRALEHAHARGILHRDLRPHNLLLSRRGELKLTNFAVASTERMPTAPELLDGGAGYTGPSYMSPEQILGEPPDPRSDVFSLGVVLYEMLAGERPFTAPDEHNESLRIRSEPAAPLARRVPELLPALERIVQRCLEKLPNDRFAASEVRMALEAAARELRLESPEAAILSALSMAGLVSDAPTDGPEVAPAPTGAGGRISLSRALLGLFLASGLLVAGGLLIQLLSRREEESGGTQGGTTRLELMPQSVSYLRVVAQPWAHVIVDGQHVDTTPFARSIPLSAGTHYVRLEHPNAQSERRTIHLTPGETLLLDVALKVAPPREDAGPPPPVLGDAGLDDASP